MVEVTYAFLQCSTFSVANGVWQGGLLSPILFTVYIDELLQRLISVWDVTGKACLPAASVMWTTSLYQLHPHMVFVIERNLMFNAGKTQLICFRRHSSIVVDDYIKFCGQKLNFSESVCHLGHMLSCDLSDSIQTVIEMKTKEFIRCANCLHLNFGMCSPAVKSSLLRSFCMSFYGAALWRMTCPQLHSTETAVNKFLCRI